MKQFQLYYNPARFWPLDNLLRKTFTVVGPEKFRKTLIGIGPDLNFYIDSSDGLNEDAPKLEMTTRIQHFIKECNGKRFIFFKCYHSVLKSKDIIDLALSHNGVVHPFFMWSTFDPYRDFLLPKIHELRSTRDTTPKEYEVGYFANLDPYITDGYSMYTRLNMFNILKESGIKLLHRQAIPYTDYISESFKCELVFCPSGFGETSTRMYDYLALHQPFFMRKNQLDFGLSWKQYIPELDLNKDIKKQITEMIKNKKDIQDKIAYYNDVILTPEMMIQYLLERIQ